MVFLITDPLSGYTWNGIAHNESEVYILVNQMIWQLRHDFGPDCDVSQITVSPM